MSFAIEVPGEAIPLSLPELGRALEAVTSTSDHAQRQAAGTQLTSWESREGFFSSLQVSLFGCPIDPVGCAVSCA